jgi:hypothetical protein
MKRRNLSRAATLAAVVCALAMVAAGTDRAAAAETAASGLTSAYLLDDRTQFFIAGYTVVLGVVSTAPEPPAEALAVYAHEAFCWLEHHPDVRLGRIPFTPPVTIRFYHVTPEQLAAGPQPSVPPVFEATVSSCGRTS